MNELIDFKIFIILVLLISIILAIILYLYNSVRMRSYDSSRNRVQLEMLRENFESKIYNLTDRMTVTEERWKDINHLLISAQKEMKELSIKPNKIYLTNFLKLNNINENDIKIDNKLVFVLTPFHNKYIQEFEIINNVCRNIGIQCRRGDEEFVKGNIFQHIISQMLKARLIFANINGRNPNVFYELGIAQALDKDTIIISKKDQDSPFDIQSNRIIFYKTHSELSYNIQRELLKLFSKD